MLSVRDDEKTKVAALNSGADDYLTKPFGAEELQARIQTESTAVGNEMTKLQLFRMLAETEDKLVAEQQSELVLSRAGKTNRLQDQMVPASFGN